MRARARRHYNKKKIGTVEGCKMAERSDGKPIELADASAVSEAEHIDNLHMIRSHPPWQASSLHQETFCSKVSL